MVLAFSKPTSKPSSSICASPTVSLSSDAHFCPRHHSSSSSVVLMATESSVPPTPSDDRPNSSTAEAVQPMSEVQQVAKPEAPKPSPPSVFVNSEPMREDQVQNAVKFLSHPKVRGSPVMYRRSFLEKKGLTKEEIDEAFRRVPDPSPSAQATNSNQEGQVTATPTVQPAASTQTLQPIGAAQTGVVSSMGIVARRQFHWYHAVFAVGFLAVAGASTAVLVKKSIIPRLKSWIRKVVSEDEVDDVNKPQAKPSLAEEAAAAAKSAAAAAADVAKASQGMLISKNEEKRYFEELMSLLDVQVREMKSMGASIRKLEGQNNNLGRTFSVEHDDQRYSSVNHKIYMNGKAENDSRSVRSSSPPTSSEPSAAPHPNSYMEIMTMVQRGEKPPNVRDIDDRPPNPNQQISSSRMAPRAKPWEAGQRQLYASGDGLNSKVTNGISYQMDSESNATLWQRKGPRISEIENADEPKSGTYGEVTTELPVQRRWVPPQPPPVAMPEAAEAIRRPKQYVQKEQPVGDQNGSNPTDAAEELPIIMKKSESNGAMELNGGESRIDSSEIQEVLE